MPDFLDMKAEIEKKVKNMSFTFIFLNYVHFGNYLKHIRSGIFTMARNTNFTQI